MKIRRITDIKTGANYARPKQRIAAVNPQNNNVSLNKISSEHIKANFLPSFKGFRKAGEATLINRKTGEETNVIIQKENILNEYLNYRLVSKSRKQLGLMEMTVHADFPSEFEDKPVGYTPVLFKTYPEISHLRSIAGDEYAGIGSTLVKLAIEESKKYGYEGALWLYAEQGYMFHISKYQSDTNPIPFYYKIGFRATGERDKQYSDLMKRGLDFALPEQALLVFSPEALNENNKYLAKNFTLY